MNSWVLLFGAIFSEVIGTSALKAAEGFTKAIPSLVVVVGYASSFYLLSLTLKSIPLGIAYAVWSGIGISLIALIGWVVYGQSLDKFAIAGMLLIISGVVILNISSKISN